MGTYIFCFFVVTHVSVGSDPTSAKSRDSMFDTERVTKGDESRPNWRHLVYRFMCLFEPNLFPQFDSMSDLSIDAFGVRLTVTHSISLSRSS